MNRRDHRGLGCRIDPDVQGEQVSDVFREPIHPSAGMITQCVGDFVDHQVRSDERSEEHTSELQSRPHLVCRLLLEKKKQTAWSIVPLGTSLTAKFYKTRHRI